MTGRLPLWLLVLACASGNSWSCESEDCSVSASAENPVAIADVCFRESTPPHAFEQNLTTWYEADCDPTYRGPQGYLQCSALEDEYDCRSVRKLDAVADWLDQRTDALKCLSCQPEAWGMPCECSDGLDRHGIGMGGVVCDYLLLIDGGNVTAIKTPRDFVERFAPVEDAAEALAFVALLGKSVEHLFDRNAFIGAGSAVDDQPTTYESKCSVGSLRGTYVEEVNDDFVVHTYEVPDLGGCTFDSLAQVTYRVSRSGEVELVNSQVVCNAGVPCYD